MFGLLDLMTKRVNDQIVAYAAAQSEIARRLWANWLDPFNGYQPVKIDIDRDAHCGRAHRDVSRRR